MSCRCMAWRSGGRSVSVVACAGRDACAVHGSFARATITRSRREERIMLSFDDWGAGPGAAGPAPGRYSVEHYALLATVTPTPSKG
eukprot:5343827-Prymnesium_polylepis.1